MIKDHSLHLRISKESKENIKKHYQKHNYRNFADYIFSLIREDMRRYR